MFAGWSVAWRRRTFAGQRVLKSYRNKNRPCPGMSCWSRRLFHMPAASPKNTGTVTVVLYWTSVCVDTIERPKMPWSRGVHCCALCFFLLILTFLRRTDLIDKHWRPFLHRSSIDVTDDLDHLRMLTDGATVAAWNNQSLPSDRMSTENATILTNCERWPLMIDPQLQGAV